MVTVTNPSPGVPVAEIAADGAAALIGLDPQRVLALYRTHGAVLLRGFAYDLEAFRSFCRALCPTAAINESPGRVAVAASEDVQSVNLGEDAFPLHPELSREPWKPDTAFFACLAPPAPGDGGETTLCDGVVLVDALAPAVREAFAARRLVYLMPTWPGLFEFWLGTPAPTPRQLATPPRTCPYRFVALADGTVMRSFSRPALHRPMFTERPAFGNFLLFARYHVGRSDFPLLDDLTEVPQAWTDAVQAAAEPLTYAHAWRQGDILMLDNTRFMHGRRAIGDARARRIVTYFGYLAGAPRDPEEPLEPIWRRQDFTPPRNPAMIRR
jgi:alpha-ketoglutarate-dependent taurine dioxygenase